MASQSLQSQQKHRRRGTFLRVLKYMAKYWPATTVAMLCVVAVTYLNVIVPLIIREVVDKVLVQNMYDQLAWLSLSIIVIAALRSVFSFTQRFTQQYIGQKVVFDLRNNLFKSLEEKSFSFYDQAQTGQLMSRVTSDVEQVRALLAWWLETLVSSVLTVGSVVLVISTIDPRLMLFYLATIPLVLVAAYNFSKRIRPRFALTREIFGDMTSVIQQTIVGTRVVRAFAQEEHEKKKFSVPHSRYLKTNLEIWRYRSMFMPFMAFTVSLGTALVYWYGGGEVIRGNMTIGSLVASAAYLAMLVMPVRFIGFLMTFYQQAITGAERIFEIMDAKPEVEDKPDAIELPPIQRGIVFKDVFFEYAPGARVLDRINLAVKMGETIALLGATGSGKSSLIQLIPRFYDVTEGSITIDGYDLRDVTLRSLRQQIGIVLQETFLFSASIRENIAYGRPDATMGDIEKVAKIAGAHDFIMSFPDKYDTKVGERGVTLSGGQRQRIAIARALLLNPRILIFDDSTSSVDVETEHEIQQALQILLKNRTTFIITQRVSTIKNATRIVVFENGAIVEEGSHEELLAKDGIYAKIYRTQFKEQEDILEAQAVQRRTK
ncbi:ABC transporter ATP-binding protein/permease [Candidatus Bathyarchaeota archaeon]|nr:ABC transporter ATP-binding protein/permease [Candidatus Bathyarchaeota archaeon]